MFMGASPEIMAAWDEGVAAAAKLIELEPSGSTGYGWMACSWYWAVAGTRRWSMPAAAMN
jgi:hypothetical protein